MVAFSFAAAEYAQEVVSAPVEDAIALFNQGQDEHAKGDLLRAIELYEKALKLLPEFPEAEYQKGAAQVNLGKTVEAERSFRRALELRPDWTLALASLGTLLVRSDRLDEGEVNLTRAVKLDDSSFPAYAGLVELRMRSQTSPDVLKALLEKIKSFSSRANPTAAVWTAQAALENALGDLAAARSSLSRALAVDPGFLPALYARADLAITQNDLVLAEDISKSIEKKDHPGEALVLLKARIAASRGDLAQAKQMISALVSPSSASRSLLNKLSALTERSPAELEKQLETDPRDPVLLGRLCIVYRTADAMKSLDYCRRAFELEPSNITHAIGYGAAMVQAGKFVEAVGLLRRLLSVAPDNSSVHANLGTALFQLKRFAEAKTEYQWLTARQPELAVAYYFLAICHDQLKEYMDAAANYNLFLRYADASKNGLEIEKVKLRLPALQKYLKRSAFGSKHHVPA